MGGPALLLSVQLFNRFSDAFPFSVSAGFVCFGYRCSGAEHTACPRTLDPWAPATFAVAWAGETTSRSWFHIARDYTEKWHQQQQIREAVSQPAALMTPELFRPFMETMVRGLPRSYRAVTAPLGTRVQVVTGPETDDAWQLERTVDGWALAAPAATVALPPPLPGSRLPKE